MPHKRTPRKENKRLDQKAERAVVKQALDGGHIRQPSSMNWSGPHNPTPIGDAPSTGRKKKRGCPKNKGGDHAPVLKNTHSWRGYIYVCDFCGKHQWGRSSKGWGAQAEPKPRQIYCEFGVYTDKGSFVQGHRTRNLAEADCAVRNARAKSLDLDTRYVVRSLV